MVPDENFLLLMFSV